MTIETTNGLIDLGDIGYHAPLAMAGPDLSLAYHCEPITMAALENNRADWQRLVNNAVDDNPFLSPAFLIPLSMHSDLDEELSLVAIWRQTQVARELVGLVPLAAQRWKYARGLMGRGLASLWKHAYQPFALPLLAGPLADAEVALATFTDWLLQRWPRIRSFAAPSVDTRTHYCEMLAAQSMQRQWPLHRGADRSSTRGLDFKPTGSMPCAIAVKILASPEDIRPGIERMLGFDATSQDRLSNGEAALLNPQRSAFLRATIRSFASEGKAILCMLDDHTGRSMSRAGAMVIAGRDQGFLWWLAGPDENNPMVEASLSAAAEKHLGKPVFAACQNQLAGLWAQPIRTEDWLMPLEADRKAMRA